METTEGFLGVRCLSCNRTHPPTAQRCPDCDGIVDPVYANETLETAHESLFDVREETTAGSAGMGTARTGGIGQFSAVLPFGSDQLVTLGEGGVSLVSSPSLADECGVERVVIVDEGRNPTGGLVDRELALAVTAAREAGAETVALPTTGNGGQAAAAYAARAGLDAECFVPSRSVFANKAMINVHGGEMSVVGGRYPDAVEVFEDASAGESWHSLAPFETPYRHEGAKTLAYAVLTALRTAPDAVVHPTGHGTGLYGLVKGFRELDYTDSIGRQPRLYAAQPAGCAPLSTAFEEGKTEHEPVEHPDTICGSLEISDPAGGSLVLDALADTDGGAVSVDDDALLEGAVSLAGMGIPTSTAGGTAVSGARKLAESGTFEGDDLLVLINPATANREADILRSHLMKQGI